jgi:UDP-N-acetylmuramoyl-L-alanyl-D-glutamate--2,6-diaminopimelate ligase
MLLSALLSGLPDPPSLPGTDDPDITHLTADSRQVRPGSLFVAVRGENFDGHHFIPDAVAKGAVAVVIEDPLTPSPLSPALGRGEGLGVREIIVPDSRLALAWLAAAWHGFPARRLVMIGVTGTDGKTTTASLIHSILTAAGLKAGLISTVNALIGDEVLDTGFHVTTPEALEIQGYLARMAAAGLTHCVLEATSHGLAQQRVTACEFDVAVVTNITHEHLDFHKSYENYRAAKAVLFESLSTAAPKPGVEKAGVLNLDDESFDYLRSILKVRSLTYSTRAPAHVRATSILHAPDGLHFQSQISNLQLPTSDFRPPTREADLQFPITTPLVGDHNVSNCLAAVAATVSALGIPPEAAQRGIAALKGVPGRMERIDLGQPFTALVDFAHTPNALRRALETARQMVGKDLSGVGRVIAVFGSAGARDIEKRRLMAEVSAELADVTLLTAEDPRTEPLDAILEMMAWGAKSKGGVEGQTFFRVPDRGEAIRLAVSIARPGDVVLACGKGHEQTMCFGATEYPWDDRVAMRAALAELLGAPGPEMPRLPTTKG